MSALEAEDLPSISNIFDINLKKWDEIDNSDRPFNSVFLQDKIQASIKALEELTISVSYLGIFSSNESFDEISTNSIKFLLLPVLLGSLTLKNAHKKRQDLLKISIIYFKDFLKRCTLYQLTSYIDPMEEDEQSSAEKNVDKQITNSKPTPEDLRRLGRQRDEKIQRYHKRTALNEKLSELKKAIENPSQDEEVIRSYYKSLIDKFIWKSHDEIDALSIELDMLQKMNIMISKQDSKHKDDTVKPLRPFLITKNEVQKKVFGAGYPSLPVLTVEEFYDQRVKDGWFPPRSDSSTLSAAQEAPVNPEDENGEEENEDNDRERLCRRDEWRDTHRTGWGNTHNRS